MHKKSFITVIVVMVCFLMVLSGCNAAKNVDNANGAGVTSPTPTTSTTGLTNKDVADASSPAPTTPPNSITQTPDSTSTNQADLTEIVNTTGINTGLPDGTKVKLFVSGKEIHWAIIMGDEALVPDYPYTFGQLNNSDGSSANIWTITTTDVNTNIENALIYNSQYSIEITEGEFTFTCNDETFSLTVPAQTIDGHFYVPLVALAEAINATVEWDADEQAINFFYKQIVTPTAVSKSEEQTPDSLSASQINPSESKPVTALETGLDDGTEVKLIVSGQELVKHGAVIMLNKLEVYT